MSQYNTSYINPQQLMLTPTYDHPQRSQGHRGSQHHVSGTGNAHAHGQTDPATLMPGAVHLLERRAHVSPQAVLNGRPPSPYISCYFLPRRPEYCGTPPMPSISFTVQGEMGPSVRSVVTSRAQIDGAYDPVMEGHGWRRMQYAIDWPDIPIRIERIPVHDENGKPLTRDMFAKEMCARAIEILKRHPNVARNIDWRSVRLIALSFYHGTWVPIWAIDS